MKNILAILLLSCSGAFAQSQQSFTITGRLTGVPAKQVHITYWSGKGQQTESADVVNNTYQLQFTAAAGQTASLRCGELAALPTPETALSIFLAPASFSITHKQTFSNAAFTGSVENVEYQQLYGADWAYGKKMEALRTKINNAQLSADPSAGTAFGEELTTMSAARTDAVYGEYMRNNPASPILVYAFNKYAGEGRGLSKEKVLPLFNLLPDSIKALPNAQAFLQRFKNAETFETVTNIGSMAPDFAQPDTLDNPVKLSSFRGKYVLLDFWASWCGPCRADNPNIVKAYQKFHDKGFDILSVSLDQPGARAKWMKAIHDDKLTWTHVSDLQYWDSPVVKLYGIQGIPQNFLIDPEGKIIARSLRGDDLEKKLGEVFKEN